MRIGELAQRAGVTPKALRYYERLGLLEPGRSSNGYREYDESHLRAVLEIRGLAATGISARKSTPFLECLASGHDHGDDCVSSLAAYRDSITEIDQIIATLRARRALLVERLDAGASRTFTEERPMTDYTTLPAGLPVPEDDGAAAHLPGRALPSLAFRATDGREIDLGRLAGGRAIVYLYPLTGRPGVDLPEGWDAIPGARGCSTEACDFRDHFDELAAEGVTAVFGMSSQHTDYQAEVVDRLRLPFPMLSDEQFLLADALSLPTFAAEGHDRLYARLTLVIREGRIEHVFYPIFPPNTHAQQVLAWLRENPV
ncbi:MerR family transcriptional regulator [Leifsonia sp. AG29]|uniref:MerR family transcriptional regulator n=1 Tax=Leifsonia sp. AG29 TaxID=2598860 RepID=UPI00131ECF0B|nr:MerR family transcriptional regulator [Leifsonia sp. AG29]